ncbi:MAG: YicC/YloC family endoribonuclease [Salibacteraceae bacterium]
MTFSMTGYGKSVVQIKGRALTIEIRTLNSKQGDLNLRIPSVYREKEMELRDLISASLQRGKIDLLMQRDLAEGEAATQLNESLVSSYYEQLKTLSKQMDETASNNALEYLGLILKMPDALKPVAETLEPEEYDALKNGLIDCIDKVSAFRHQEGQKLEKVLLEGTKKIEAKLSDITPLEQERMDRIKKRISDNLDETDSNNLDQDRYEQELIYYLEKLDITEEKVRLKAHCEYFLKTLKDEKVKGKKLSFIAQEMGREINTLGSKAQHSEMQRLVVEMKDELEKIKEQVLNVL